MVVEHGVWLVLMAERKEKPHVVITIAVGAWLTSGKGENGAEFEKMERERGFLVFS